MRSHSFSRVNTILHTIFTTTRNGLDQGRSSRNSRYTEKLDRLPIWLSNTCHGTSTLQICKLMDRSTCLPISEAPRMFWNTSEETAFPELNLKLIVYILFNNIFFQIHILLQISCHFWFMLYALAGIYTKHNLKKNNLKKKTSTQQNLNLVAFIVKWYYYYYEVR